MGILSGLLSFSAATSRSVLFAPLCSSNLPPRKTQTLRRTPPPMCFAGLNQQQQHNSNNKLKFLLSHQHIVSPRISLLSTEEDDPIISISSGHGFGDPVASCHELLLMCRNYRLHDLLLWNPSTKEVIKTLPQSSVPRPPSAYEWIALYGFGFDPRASSYDIDYKVILCHSFEFEDDHTGPFMTDGYIVELYSLKTDSWKRIAYPHALPDARPKHHASIYINGFNYWPAYTGTSGEDFVIISFDFSNDSFPSALIPGPKNYKNGRYDFLLVEFEGSLAVIVYLTPNKFELWVYNHNNNNNGEAWSRRGAWAISIPVVLPLGLLKNNKFYFQDSMGELLLFDCAKEKLKNLGLYADQKDVLRMFPYVESSAEEIK